MSARPDGEPELQGIVDSLVEDLQPVHRLPRLRIVLVGCAALWILGWLGLIAIEVMPARLREFDPWGEGALAIAIAGGLLGVGIGGLLAGVAGAVPGRGAAGRLGAGVAGLGALVAVGAGLAYVSQAGLGSGSIWQAIGGVDCPVRAALLSAAPAAGAFALLAQGLPRSAATLAFAGFGAAGLGALAMALVCPGAAGAHVLFAHVLAPLWVCLVLAAPTWWLLRRFVEE